MLTYSSFLRLQDYQQDEAFVPSLELPASRSFSAFSFIV